MTLYIYINCKKNASVDIYIGAIFCRTEFTTTYSKLKHEQKHTHTYSTRTQTNWHDTQTICSIDLELYLRLEDSILSIYAVRSHLHARLCSRPFRPLIPACFVPLIPANFCTDYIYISWEYLFSRFFKTPIICLFFAIISYAPDSRPRREIRDGVFSIS